MDVDRLLAAACTRASNLDAGAIFSRSLSVSAGVSWAGPPATRHCWRRLNRSGWGKRLRVGRLEGSHRSVVPRARIGTLQIPLIATTFYMSMYTPADLAYEIHLNLKQV